MNKEIKNGKSIDILVCHFRKCNGAVEAKTILIIILLSFFTIFILQNTEVVEISFLFWQMSLSRVVLLLGSLFTGILIGLFIGWETATRKKKE
jgi:uncharacterized integral membrane protein